MPAHAGLQDIQCVPARLNTDTPKVGVRRKSIRWHSKVLPLHQNIQPRQVSSQNTQKRKCIVVQHKFPTASAYFGLSPRQNASLHEELLEAMDRCVLHYTHQGVAVTLQCGLIVSLIAKPSACCTFVTQKLVVFSPVAKSWSCRWFGKYSRAGSSTAPETFSNCARACTQARLVHLHSSGLVGENSHHEKRSGLGQIDSRAAQRCFLHLQPA